MTHRRRSATARSVAAQTPEQQLHHQKLIALSLLAGLGCGLALARDFSSLFLAVLSQ
jgi:hypothetical protein